MKIRLLVTMQVFMLMMTASPLGRAQDTTGADAREVKAYRLTMPKMTAFYAATKSLRKVAATEPKACAVVEPSEGDESKTLSERAKKMEASYPKIVPLLKAEGLTAREILVLTLIQMQAGMAVYAKSMGMKDMPMEVNPENVTFMEQHKKELDAMTADLKKVPDPCKHADQDDDSEDAQ